MLSKIRLELARGPGSPEGDSRDGYEFTAPLDGEGHIDADAWRGARASSTVRRFAAEGEDKHGRLVRRPGGAWAFHYEGEPDPGDDASGYRLSTHRFRPGEYVSIQEEDGEMLTYRVAAVSRALRPQILQRAAWPQDGRPGGQSPDEPS